MANWLVIGLIVLGAFIVSLFFEDARGWYAEIWDYIITFEWWSEFWEFIGSAFENIGEFSYYGLVFGLLGAGLIFALREQMIEPFLKFYKPAGRLFWTIVTYIGVFLGGYFMGKAFENS